MTTVLISAEITRQYQGCAEVILDDGFSGVRAIIHESKIIGTDRLKAAPKKPDHARAKRKKA